MVLTPRHARAQVGCMLATWENRQDDMNKKLAEIMKALFRGRDDLFLPVVLIDEDGPGPTKLAPDALQDPVQQKKPQTKPQTQEVANQACHLGGFGEGVSRRRLDDKSLLFLRVGYLGRVRGLSTGCR